MLNFPFNGRPVTYPYKNYKGEVAARTLTPIVLFWGSNEWHPEPQWLLEGYDHDKQALRTFALAGFLEAKS